MSTSVAYSVSKGHDVVMLHCNPIIEGIKNPSTITVDIKWWILENEEKESKESGGKDIVTSKKRMVFEESFRLSTKTYSTLNRQYWRIGNTVSLTK